MSKNNNKHEIKIYLLVAKGGILYERTQANIAYRMYILINTLIKECKATHTPIITSLFGYFSPLLSDKIRGYHFN